VFHPLIQARLCHSPQVVEAAVLGLQSDQWGQKVAAVVVLNEEDAKAGGRGGKPWGLMDMRRALKDRLASYKLPQEMKVVPNGLPRNAMGKGRLSCPFWRLLCAPLLTYSLHHS
jgi:acyl-coenzyme A synthetase/AMP-(fatty) acid ligase